MTINKAEIRKEVTELEKLEYWKWDIDKRIKDAIHHYISVASLVLQDKLIEVGQREGMGEVELKTKLFEIHRKYWGREAGANEGAFLITIGDALTGKLGKVGIGREDIENILDREFGISLRECGFTEGVIQALKDNATTDIIAKLERR